MRLIIIHSWLDDKFSGTCKTAIDLSTKICVLSKKTDVNVKVFDMIIRINEAKTLIKHISCDYKCKFNSTACNSNQKWNCEIYQHERKNYCTCTQDFSGF